jgi:AraC-like DNA-binding protein
MQRDDALARIDHGGGGAITRVVCGFVGSQMRRHPLLEALPQLLILDLNGRPESEWVALSFRFAAQEVAAARAGSETVLARLSELLFVEAARDYLAALPPEQHGWLAGLRDPAVGRALALMHGQPAHPWTSEELATAVLLSRSAFAERFTTLVGVPPMSYLTAWRMQVAAQGLRESRRSIAQIAEAVGYESEAAFARAFKREMGSSPGEYRRQG